MALASPFPKSLGIVQAAAVQATPAMNIAVALEASPLRLSEVELRACRTAAGWLNHTSLEQDFANAAYRLGIERGMAERAKFGFICDRCGLRQDSKMGPAEAMF